MAFSQDNDIILITLEGIGNPTVYAPIASYTVKGIASFSDEHFIVSNGHVNANPIRAIANEAKGIAQSANNIAEEAKGIAEEAKDIAQSVENRADAGEFKGDKGDIGPVGPEGPIGPQGLQGPQGIQGQKGDSGTSVNIIGEILNSVDDLPPFEDTNPGDAYIVKEPSPSTLLDMYYHSFGENDWNIIQDWGGVPGPQGPQGPQGEKGSDGINIPLPTGFFRVEIREDGHLWVVTPDGMGNPLRIDNDSESPTYGHLILTIEEV